MNATQWIRNGVHVVESSSPKMEELVKDIDLSNEDDLNRLLDTDFYTVAEAAQRLRISTAWLRYLTTRAKRLNYVRLSNKVLLVSRDDVELAYAIKREREPGEYYTREAETLGRIRIENALPDLNTWSKGGAA